MYWLANGLALLLAFAIIAIGFMYVVNPASIMGSFGLPLPDVGPNTAWWLRLKGVRDVVSGLTVLALMAWGGPLAVGIVLLVKALTAVGDGALILAAKGSARTAFGVHGVTALVMIVAGVPLIMGVR